MMALANMEPVRPTPPMFPFFAPQFPPNMTSMAAERFRFPIQSPFQFNPAVFHAALHAGVVSQPLQALQSLHHHHHQQQPQQVTSAAVLSSRMPPTAPQTPISTPVMVAPVTTPLPLAMPRLALAISQEELDMVLYGYTRGRSSDRYHGHALSGLKFGGDLTHGIDRILSQRQQQSSSPDSSTPHTVRCGSSCSSNCSNCNVTNKNLTTSTSSSSAVSHNHTTTNNNNHHNHPHHHNHHRVSTPNSYHQEATQEDCKPLAVTCWGRDLSVHGAKYNSNSTITTPDGSPCNNSGSNKNVNHGQGNANCKQTGVVPLDVAALDLQDGLAIYQTQFAGTNHCGVFCTKTVISRGTRYGPFKGRVVHTSEVKTHDDNTCMWEVFQDGKLSHFIDGRGSLGNWMAYINCARYAQEQNLIAVQVDGEIWYEACKDIPQGTELLVWYGDCYLQFMGVPVALKEMADGGAQEEADTSEGFKCERCGKVFAYKYYRDKHLKYTRCVDQGDRKYPCHLCSRSFEKRDRLRIHILHVHEKHRPHKCLVCGKSFSQSSSLNKHMRVHSGERPYKCVYCNKAFTASSILRTHIRQHSGEKPFKCKHCGKAFASHAAHDSHVRRTHAKERPCACSVCGKTFQQAYELKFHMGSHMNQC